MQAARDQAAAAAPHLPIVDASTVEAQWVELARRRRRRIPTGATGRTAGRGEAVGVGETGESLRLSFCFSRV